MKRDQIDEAYLEELRRAAQALKEGDVLLYPSDSLWGLGCDATNKEAIDKIFEIKERQKNKSLITLVADYRQLQKVVREIPSVAEDILEYSTEPVTVIYPSANAAFEHLSSEDGKIAVRMIKSGYAHDLMSRSSVPLTSTSVNKSGEPSPLNYSEISTDIINSVDFVSNPHFQGELSGKASRIMLIEMDGSIKIIR